MEAQQLILEKLDKIEEDIAVIKEVILDEDTVLTEEEEKLVEEYHKHKKEGSLVSLEEFKHARNKAR